tara:strand:+ start:13710 stop:14567 length:858 start_codon:yes stop_codon:yes gene_type:complete
MSDKNKITRLLKRALIKYRFVVMTDDSFEEKISLKFNRLKLFSFIICFLALVFICSFLLISNTTIKNLVPGISKEDLEEKVIRLSIKTDSLIAILNYQKTYLNNLENIINGNVNSFEEKLSQEELQIDISKINFSLSAKDSLFRISVEEEEKGTLNFNKVKNNLILFFPPISGVITDRFSTGSLHYGIDLVAKENTRVASVLAGTIILSEWNPNTGHTIAVQHKDGYLSFYKHNSVLLRSTGDYVKKGEHIAIIGDSGEYSSGPHLHFELWHNGIAVDPEKYIAF